MKKLISVVTALILVVMLLVPIASADSASAGRQQAEEQNIVVDPLNVLPETITLTDENGNRAYEIVEIDDTKDKDDEDYFEHRVWVPVPDVYMYTYGNRKQIVSADDVLNFEKSYAVVKKNTTDAVIYFFWLNLTDSYLEYLEEYEDYYFRLDFVISDAIKDGNIAISLDGVDISNDLILINGDGTMTVFFEYLPAAVAIRVLK